MGRITSSTTTVKIGPLLATDTEAKYRDQKASDVWNDYVITSRYEKDRHTYMMATAFNSDFSYSLSTVTGTTNTVQTPITAVQLASPSLLWIVDWTCSRYNEKPWIPNPSLANNFAWVLLDEVFEPYQIQVAPDGVSPLWRISGTYVYGNMNPSAITIDDLLFPMPPYLLDFVERNVPKKMLKHGIIDIGQSPKREGKLDWISPVS